ncbi:MAG: HEPN domain-containing protein [Ruminiclostridium sp.]|nr:HEPN domain-containing protein [Ruminiclostridium sp.]
MTPRQDRIDLARYYITKARDRYEDGLVLKNMDRYESAANRLYYALFHTANAVLALKDAASNRHRGVKTLFDMHFIKTGLLDKKYSKLYNIVLEVREDSDYEEFYIIDKAEVDSNFVQVKGFIDYADTFIADVASGRIKLGD